MRNKSLLIGVFLLLLSLMVIFLPSCGASFAVTSIAVSPPEIGIGGTTFVIVKVQNSGRGADSYNAVLKVNGQEVDNQQVVLGAGGSQTLTFALSESAEGTYQVSVGSLNASLSVVKNPVTPVPAPLAITGVPAAFQPVYANLGSALDLYSTYLNSQTGTKYPVTFGAELLPANCNRGPELLQPQVIAAVRVYLDRLQELGVKGVTIPIHYPLYTPTFPRYTEYVAFYKQVEQEVRKRGLKLEVESHVIFANTPFSPIQFDFSTVTFAQYEAGRRQVIQSVLTDLHPDYVNIGAEPDTEAKLSGFSQLSDPAQYAAYVNYLTSGLNKGSTIIAAGIGTWGDVAYIRDFVSNKNLDCISLHVYPVVGDTLQKTLQVINLAQQNHKRVIMDEAWLYKVDNVSGGTVAANTEVFKRDAFSFWAPLDQQFLDVIVNLARTKNIEYISPFWSSLFFSYLDYNTSNASLSYAATVALLDQSVATNITQDKFSATGDAYRKLIQSNP